MIKNKMKKFSKQENEMNPFEIMDFSCSSAWEK